jgi:hypothetical protein
MTAALEAINRLVLGLTIGAHQDGVVFYSVGLAAYGLILLAIREKTGRPAEIFEILNLQCGWDHTDPHAGSTG